MMHTWFETKVSYEKEIEGGVIKKVTEPYLVDALSFTEAEARIIKEITPFMSGEFTVANMKRANYTEVFTDETGDRWYKAKLLFITIDEKSGVEKKSASNMLVQAADIHQAIANLDKGMSTSMADYEIASITETMLMDIFPFSVDDDKNEKQ